MDSTTVRDDRANDRHRGSERTVIGGVIGQLAEISWREARIPLTGKKLTYRLMRQAEQDTDVALG